MYISLMSKSVAMKSSPSPQEEGTQVTPEHNSMQYNMKSILLVLDWFTNRDFKCRNACGNLSPKPFDQNPHVKSNPTASVCSIKIS